MRNYVVALLAGTALASTAQGADLPSAPILPEATPVPVVADWTGVYVGITGGWGWGDFDVHSSGVAQPPEEVDYPDFSIDADGGFVGGQAGYDRQFGHFVLGIVGDLSWADIGGSEGVRVDGAFQDSLLAKASINDEDDFATSVGIDWFGTLRGRVGFTAGNFLAYATGGLAFGGTETEVGYRETPSMLARGAAPSLPGDFDSSSHRDTRVGFAVGGGVAAKLSQHFVADIGYLFVDLGDETFDVEDQQITRGHADVDYKLHLVRAGLSYKF